MSKSQISMKSGQLQSWSVENICSSDATRLKILDKLIAGAFTLPFVLVEAIAAFTLSGVIFRTEGLDLTPLIAATSFAGVGASAVVFCDLCANGEIVALNAGGISSLRIVLFPASICAIVVVLLSFVSLVHNGISVSLIYGVFVALNSASAGIYLALALAKRFARKDPAALWLGVIVFLFIFDSSSAMMYFLSHEILVPTFVLFVSAFGTCSIAHRIAGPL